MHQNTLDHRHPRISRRHKSQTKLQGCTKCHVLGQCRCCCCQMKEPFPYEELYNFLGVIPSQTPTPLIF